MRLFLIALNFAAVASLLMSPATAGEDAGSNIKPLTYGFDQTIIDIRKVKWTPLRVDGLAPGAEIAILRGSLGNGAEILLKFPPDYKVPNHSHASDETYVWLQGSFTLVSFQGERTKFDGPAFISFPGSASPHGLECGSSEPCILYVRYSRACIGTYADHLKRGSNLPLACCK